MKSRVFTVILILLLPASARGELNLKAVVELGLVHSPKIKSADLQQFKADNALSDAEAAFLPSIDASGDHGLRGTEVGRAGENEPWNSQASLSISETIYDGGRLNTALESAEIGLESARLSRRLQVEDLSLELVSAYYDLVLETRLQDVAKARFDAAAEQSKRVAALRRQGMKTENEALQFQAQQMQADVALKSAELSVAARSRTLFQTMGLDPETQKKVALIDPMTTPLKIPEATYPDLENHPRLRVARLQIDGSKVAVVQRTLDNLPQLKASAGATYGSANYMGTGQTFADNDTLGWNATLGLTYNIVDWGTRRRAIRNARADVSLAEQSYTESRLAFETEARNLLQNLEISKVAYELERKTLEIQERSFNLLKEEHRRGKASYLQLIVGLNDLMAARTNYERRYFSMLKLISTYRYQQGRLYDWIQKGS